MLQFLQPGWLWMASVIVVPVLIHLWNIREGKTLKIGSTLLLQQSTRQHARSFRIREWLLLLLRCLLMLLLALLLAEPGWLSQPKVVQQKGWVVVEKENRKELYRIYRRQIDSLLDDGLQLHYFEAGFPPAKKEALTQAMDSLAPDVTSYWPYAAQLSRQAPPGKPVYLYTGNQLHKFRGIRPALPLNLHWQVATQADSVSSWLAGAFLTTPDSIRVIKAASNPAFLRYTAETISATGAPGQGYTTGFESGKLLLSLAGNQQPAPVEVNTTTLRVVVFTDRYKQDALYLQAAIRAIRQYSQHRISLQLVNDRTSNYAPPDWLFWLSDQPAPSPVNCTVFRYITGKERRQPSWIMQENRESTGEPILLYKTMHDSIAGPDDEVVWHDGFGLPVLTKRSTGNTTFFNFYSRFDPQWTDLPWSSRFPIWMLQLLLKDQRPQVDRMHDKRVLDEQQLAAAVVPMERNKPAALPPEKTDLCKSVWIAAFLIFLLERILSHRKRGAA